MSRLLALIALVACCCALPLLAADTAAEPNAIGHDWRRQPEARLSRLPAPPTIDGSVTPREWLYACELGPLKTGVSGVAVEMPRRVLMGYDDQALYIAVQLHRPANALTPLSPNNSGRGDQTGKGDAIEIMICPDLNFDQGFAFYFYPNGGFGDAVIRRDKDKRYNPDWSLGTRLTDFGWEAELAIPFAALGLDAPPTPDAVWGFDLIDNRQTPYKLLSHWSYRGSLWHAYEYFGQLRFGQEPAVRFETLGDVGGGQMAALFSVVNGTDAAADVSVDLQILRRKEGAEGGPKSYYANIDSGMSHDAQADFYKGTNLIAEIDSALTFYTLMDEGAHRQSLSIPAGERRGAGRTWPIAYGEYLALYTVSRGDTVLARGATPYIVEPPLALKLEPYWLYSQLIDVTANLQKVAITGPATAVFTLHGPDLGAAITEARVPVQPGAFAAQAALSVAGQAPGYYRVHCRLLDADGQEIAASSEPIERPETPAWYRNHHGNQVKVPPPWTPVAATPQGQVSVWGRVHQMDSLLPRSILVNGQEVLARPVRLDLTVGGQLVDWTIRDFTHESTTADRVVYRGVLDSPVAQVSGSVSVEFDGFIWYDLRLTPKQADLTVDSLDIAIDILPEFAELVSPHKYLIDPIFQNGQPMKPLKNGGAGALGHSQTPFAPSLWIGNEAAGMTFIAEAPIDWIVDRPNGVLETLPAVDGAPAGIRAHVIDHAAVLTRPMRLEFGLQATPIRPFAANRKSMNIFQKSGVFGNPAVFKQLKEKGCEVVVFYYSWRGNNRTEMGGTPERPPDPEQAQRLKNAVKQAHAAGLKVIMFTGWGINASSENWKRFGLELGRYPVHNQGWGTFGQSAGPNGGYGDFMAWGHHDLITEYGVDGVLWDSTSNIAPDTNSRIGTSWTDAEGRTRPAYAVRATRDVYRRVYTLYKSEATTDGIIYNHGGSMWCINAFADILNRGEGSPMSAPTIRAGWNGLEAFRAAYSGEPFGLLFSGDNNDFAELPMRVSTHLALYQLHGLYHKEYSYHALKQWKFTYAYNDRPLVKLWELYDWFAWDDSTRRHYYYQDQQVVIQEPSNLLSSAFVSGDGRRALICVSNLDRDPVEDARVRIDFEALGLADGELHLADAILHHTPLALADDGLLHLAIDQQRYRLIKLWIETPGAEEAAQAKPAP